MSYINNEDRIKKKQQFFLLYSLTILVMVGIGYALYASAIHPKPVTTLHPSVQPVEAIDTDTVPDTDVQAIKLELEALRLELLEKEKRIAQLNKNARTSPVVTTANRPPAKNAVDSGELKFLRWALSSQSADVEKLKRENASLKAQAYDAPNK